MKLYGSRQSRLLVVLHAYYHDKVDYFIEKLRNINGCQWDIVVTYVTPSEDTEEKIRELNPSARFYQVANFGYDILPFIEVLKMVNLENYDYVLKLHTKGDLLHKNYINSVNLFGSLWRDYLVDSLLKSPGHFRKNLNRFRVNRKVGMLCSYELYKERDLFQPEDTFDLEDEAKRIGLRLGRTTFCAGSIFMARADALKRLLTIEFAPDAWLHVPKSNSNGSMAHVYERMICYIVRDAGYVIKAVPAYFRTSVKAFYHKTLRRAIRWAYSVDYELGYDREAGKVFIKRKYLCILGQKMTVR